MNGTLLFYKCRLSIEDTMRWWGHQNPALCKRICLNFLQSQAEGTQKLRVQALTPPLVPEPPGETLTIFSSQNC